MAKKTWVEKLHSKGDFPKIEDAPQIWGGGSMYIPAL